MASRTGTIPKPKTGAPAKISKTTAQILPNVAFDAATQAFLNSTYGTEAAWYNDPQIGPILKAALTAGKGQTALQGQAYQDFIRTHAVLNGKVTKVAPDQSWYGTHGATVRQAFGQKLSDVGTYNANVQQILNDQIIPLDRQLGTGLDPASLQTIAESAYTNGWGGSTNLLTTALLGQKQKMVNPITSSDAIPAGGAIGKTQSDFGTIAADYGIPIPSGPKQMENFVNGAVGPGGSPEAFTEYAKNQAKLLYPWMSGALDAGGTVKNYLTPYATTIANTLGIAPDSIDWTDSKWNGVVAKKDPNGVSVPQTLDQALATVKTDPRFGYDNTMKAKNDAYDLASSIKSMFGMGQ